MCRTFSPLNLFQKSLLISGDISTRWLGGSAVQAGLISFSLPGLAGAYRRGGCTALHVRHWLLRAPPGAPSVAQCAGPSRGGRARAPRSARCSGRGAPARGSACLRARPRLVRAQAGRRPLGARGLSGGAARPLELPRPRLAFWAASGSRCVRSGAGSAARRASGWRRRAPVGAFLRLRVRTVQPHSYAGTRLFGRAA